MGIKTFINPSKTNNELFLITYYEEQCQTEYYENTLSFLSFFFFQAVHIGSHWEVFYKKPVPQLC